MKQLTRITLDPAVMGGKACIRGLRVTVGTPGENDRFIAALRRVLGSA